MITLNTHTTITRNNPVLKLDISGAVPDGEYDVTIVLEESGKQKKQSLTFSNHKVNISGNQLFDREELYGDDGR